MINIGSSTLVCAEATGRSAHTSCCTDFGTRTLRCYVPSSTRTGRSSTARHSSNRGRQRVSLFTIAGDAPSKYPSADHWRGVQSGSHLANDEFQKIAIRELTKAETTGKIQVCPGDLVKALLSFDKKKYSKGFNYGENIEKERTLTFWIDNNLNFRIDCTPNKQVAIFSAAFNPVYQEVRKVIKLLLKGCEKANNLAILFSGGSCVGKGIHRDLRHMMESFKIDAWEAGTKINFEFMGNLNPIY